MRRALPMIAAALLACAARAPLPPHGGARHAAEAAMIAADEAFSAAAVARDTEAFARLVAPDAVFFSARGLREGREAVVGSWRPFLSEGGPLLRWAPHRAEASAEGDLGFTVGRWELTGAGETATGEYVTVWRRGDDGRLEAALDGTYLDATGEPAAAGATPVRELRSRAGDLVATLSRLDAPAGAALSLVVTRQGAGGPARVLETRVPLAPPRAAP